MNRATPHKSKMRIVSGCMWVAAMSMLAVLVMANTASVHTHGYGRGCEEPAIDDAHVHSHPHSCPHTNADIDMSTPTNACAEIDAGARERAGCEGREERGERESGPRTNQFWWPELLNLSPLRSKTLHANPAGTDFYYPTAFNALDLDAAKDDIDALLTKSQYFWPADNNNYGPLFIRMAWHAAGTYRTLDGRGGADGGQQRFEPLNSWPDNANLDKARRLLWPIKQKYGYSLSWADLLVLAGNAALENMGFRTLGWAGGRTDDWASDTVYWGAEKVMLDSDRRADDDTVERPLAATHMGLIYVDPETASAANVRLAFSRMAMDDKETVALIAGGHAFGQMHGAHNVTECVGVEPAAAPVEDQGLGWKNRCGKGNAEDTITSGLQGAWTYNPTQWDPTTYLSNLLTLEWRRTDSPAGKTQWVPTNESPHNAVPDAHIPGEVHAPVMTTADLALVHDSQYLAIAERFLAHPDELEAAFARAWFKLTHRDMGPRSRYLGPDVPDTIFLWQDHVTTPEFLISESDAGELKAEIIASSLTVSELVGAAWASASTFRASDMRGGANGARVALVPQKSWPVNNPIQLALVLKGLREIKAAFNEDPAHTTQVSLADMIVLGGATAIEKAARDAGVEVEVPFTPGRGDATQAQTDVASFAVLEPAADAFRNFYNASTAHRPPTEMLVDRASQLTLTVPEMTALLGGMRVLGVNHNASTHGVLTDRPGMLTTDFFVNLLDMGTMWHSTATCAGTAADVCVYEGVDRESGAVKYTATQVDLVFGSHAELRAVAEVYAYEGAHEAFVRDFVSAWVKVMQADRFDLHKK